VTVTQRSIIAGLPEYAMPYLEAMLPPHIEPRWYKDTDQAIASASEVEVAWYDVGIPEIVRHTPKLKWLFTVAAGVDHIPLARLQQQGIRLSNGSGLNSANVADYVIMGVLTAAKGFHHVVKAQERHEWLTTAPGRTELEGSRALVIGYGAIGTAVGLRLRALGVEVTGVRSKPDPDRGILGPEDWRVQVGDFDWIVIAAPSTPETKAIISSPEIAAMRSTAWLLNVGRGDLIERQALIEALATGRIGGAFLDVTEPEPLPPDDPLWDLPNCIITMHLSGRSQTGLIGRCARFFIDGLECYRNGQPLANEVSYATLTQNPVADGSISPGPNTEKNC